MSAQRLYKAEFVREAEENYDMGMYGEVIADPAGWAEFCEAKWGEYKPFFFPSTDKVFRSRSAAQRRVDIINHWGGRAVLVECTPEWMTVSAANAQRKAKRLKAKRARVLEELNAVTDALRAVEAVA